MQRSQADTPASKAAALRPHAGGARGGRASTTTTRGGPSRLRRAVLAVLLLALLGAGGYGAYRWSQTQYYVGARGLERRHLPGAVAERRPAADVARSTATEDIPLDDLPAYQRERVEADIATAGLDDARRIVDGLREQAEICRAQAEAAASPAPAATPSAPAGSESPAATTSPGPSTSPAPTPTPTPTDGTGRSATDCGGPR